MKTRIIQTRFYKDNEVRKLSLFGQHLFMFLLTSEHINISGIFELPDDYICLESKLSPDQLEIAKKELITLKKVLFFDGWIKVVNAEKNNQYRNSPKNEAAYQREISQVPQRILEYFDSSIDTSIDSSMHTTHNPEIINQKEGVIGGEKTEEVKAEVLSEVDLFILEFNKLRETRYKATQEIKKLHKFWRKNFTADEILLAVRNIPNHKWLSTIEYTPTIFLRTNKDWIDQCLNLNDNPLSKGKFNVDII